MTNFGVISNGLPARQRLQFENLAAVQAASFADMVGGQRIAISSDAHRDVWIYTDQDMSELATADGAQAVFIADPGDATGASGGIVRSAWLERPKQVDLSWFGAIPRDPNDATTADAATRLANKTALQNAVDLVGASINGIVGGVIDVVGWYVLDTGVLIDDGQEGIAIRGIGVREPEQSTVFNPSPSYLQFDGLTGDAIRVAARHFELHKLHIGSTATRAAATSIGKEPANGNGGDLGTPMGMGVRFEPYDRVAGVTTRLHHNSVTGCLIEGHPGDGVAFVGLTTDSLVSHTTIANNGRYGIAIDDGLIVSRTNRGSDHRGGQLTIITSPMRENGSHGIMIGAPNSLAPPYRVTIHDCDTTGNNITNQSASYDTTGNADWWLFGENIDVSYSAVDGRNGASENQFAGAVVAGRTITFRGCRFISTSQPIRLTAHNSTTPTEGFHLYGQFVGGGAPRVSLIEVDNVSGAGLTITDVLIDCTGTEIGDIITSADLANISGAVRISGGGEHYLKGELTVQDAITKRTGSQTVFRHEADDQVVGFLGGTDGTSAKLLLYGVGHATNAREAQLDCAALDTGITGLKLKQGLIASGAFTLDGNASFDSAPDTDATGEIEFDSGGAWVSAMFIISSTANNAPSGIVECRVGDGNAFLKILSSTDSAAGVTMLSGGVLTAATAPNGTTMENGNSSADKVVLWASSDEKKVYVQDRSRFTNGWRVTPLHLSNGRFVSAVQT